MHGDHATAVCRECGKTRFATMQTAERVLRRIAFLPRDDGKYPIRAYRAPCGWVHLTSMRELPPLRSA